MPHRHTLRRRGRQTPLVVALYLNAALLACLLTAVLSRDSSSAAFAAPPAGAAQPIAGGNGVYLMPGQLAVNVWGCYVLDTDRQTLVSYEYTPSQKQLRLVAARFIGHDRQLQDYNTLPSPSEIQRNVNLQNNPVRGQPGGVPPNGPTPEGTTPAAPGVQESPTPPNNNDPIRPPGERPLDRPPQPGDADYVPKASDINPPPQQ